MLLRLSGAVPDELLTRARAWLAEGHRTEMAAAVVQVGAGLALDSADVTLLAELYAEAELPLSGLRRLGTGRPAAPGDVLPGLTFAAERPGAPTAAQVSAAPAVDAPQAPADAQPSAGERDGALDALLAEVAVMPSVRGVWVAWRSPANGAPWPPPRRVFVVETDGGADLAGVVARLQRVLAAAGEAAPQVEVHPRWIEPPARTLAARTRGASVYVRDPRPQGWAARCHLMLLWIAGFVPDDMLTACRAWLAQGRFTDVALTVAHQAALTGVELYREDIELLAEIRRAAGIAVPPGEDLVGIDEPHSLPYRFGPDATEPSETGFGRSLVDPVDPPDPRTETDAVPGAFLDAIRAEGRAVRAAWSAWRWPVDIARWPPPRRVFVLEVEDDVDAPALAAHLQRVLAAAGDPNVGVEVYPVWAGNLLPPYQVWASAQGLLVHLRDARPPLRPAPFYDEVDATGPRISPDHPVLSGAERALVLGYLRGGGLVWFGKVLVEDVLRPEAGEVVPTSVHTDGHWVWSDHSWYHLLEHHLAPHPELLAHIRRQDHVFPRVDAVDLQRARRRFTSMPESAGWGADPSEPEAPTGRE
ncbi:hypothetical protein ND748_11835 [Frankia sp. AiPs1]|uniref:hypothetical protein n=1 Tax=Frankia sp. AiPs1 TaxID=573493 RepID=UPI002044CA36|nr:hypothetical protein [Frankia sp. AiPs1]MCM3922346.1 hypothetical protein [Frankia sp. AiPs1]